jgi:4-amino-4-deoxy-L-arabinose transferase-like glycosyltransferase
MGNFLVSFKRYLADSQWVLILLIAALFIWLIGLGNLPLRDWDEGYYGTVARDMFQTGNWLYPTYLGEPFFLKPPLMFWLITLSYYLGEISEFTTRFSGAFITACGVPLLYLIGKELFIKQLPSLLTALVYLTLLPVVRHGRLAMLDGIVNSFLLLCLWCLLKSYKSQIWAIGIGIGLGLIALTKGLLFIVLGAILGFFILVNRQLQIFKNPYLWLGIFLGFAPTITWYLAQVQHYGNIFLQIHFQAQSFERVSQAIEGHEQPIWYYGIELLKYTLPWLLFLPGGLALAWKQRHQSWGALVLTGMIIYLSTISLMGTKLPWYIMPVYPFFALAVGAYLAKLWEIQEEYSRILIALLATLGFLSLVGLGYFILFNNQPVLIIMAIILSLSLFLASWKMKQNNPIFIAILLVGMYTALGLLMISQSWLWELNEAFPVKPVAALIQAHTPPGKIVYISFGYNRPSLDFYSQHQVMARDLATLQQLSQQKNYLLLDKTAMDKLKLPKSQTLGEAEKFTLVLSQPNL